MRTVRCSGRLLGVGGWGLSAHGGMFSGNCIKMKKIELGGRPKFVYVDPPLKTGISSQAFPILFHPCSS